MNPNIKWLKIGVINGINSVGPDVVMITASNYLLFSKSVEPWNEVIYRADDGNRGDGISCASGHSSLSCFAFAENNKDPRILILMYPSLQMIKILPALENSYYTSLHFCNIEYLVTVSCCSSVVSYTVWNWRNAEKVCSTKSDISLTRNIVRVTQSLPLRFASRSGSGDHLNVWEMNTCCKKTLLNKNKIALPKQQRAEQLYSFTWMTDGQLYIVDSHPSLYVVSWETGKCSLIWSSKEKKLSNSEIPGITPCIVLHKNGVAIANNCDVIFLKKKQDGWLQVWKCSATTSISNLLNLTSAKECLLAWTYDCSIVAFKGEKSVSSSILKNYSCRCDTFCVIQPKGEIFVTLSSRKNVLGVWSMETGMEVTQLKLTTDHTAIACYADPYFSYAVCCFANGEIQIINCFDPNQPYIRNRVRLTHESLDQVRFNPSGGSFCVASLKFGEFFLLEVKVENNLEVCGSLVERNMNATDFLLFIRNESSSLYIVTNDEKSSVIQEWTLNRENQIFCRIKKIVLTLRYQQILLSSDSEHFIAVPSRSKVIHYLTKSGQVVKEESSGHLIANFSLVRRSKYSMTYGIDGQVICRDKKKIMVVRTHHRNDGGVTHLDGDLCGQYVVCSGEDGSLICCTTGLKQTADEIQEIHDVEAKNQMAAKLDGPRENDQGMIFDEKSWLDAQEEKRIAHIKGKYAHQKMKLQFRLQTVKSQLRKLLNMNFSALPKESLPISTFDLNRAKREMMIEQENMARARRQENELSRIRARDAVSQKIMEITWNKVSTKSRELRSISSKLSVQSYALINKSSENVVWLKARLKLLDDLHQGDFFQPWVPRTDQVLKEHVSETWNWEVISGRRSSLHSQVTQNNKVLSEPDEIWSGTTIHLFISVHPQHQNQLHITTTEQGLSEIAIINEDVERVMQWFNEKLDGVFRDKDRVIHMIHDRNERLKFIRDEIIYFNFATDIMEKQIVYPVFAPEEQPETFVVVSPEELKEPVYITPEEEAEIARRAEEAETLRRKLLADDFREKALMKMMDGVLTKCWQDQIKRDVLKPAFIDQKAHEDWTEEEKKQAKVYFEDHAQLQQQRDSYRKILLAEFMQLTNFVQELIEKFDDKVKDLFELKLQVESAIGQEQLKMLRIRQRMLKKKQLERKEQMITAAINDAEQRIQMSQEEIGKLQEIMAEGKITHDNLLSKEKTMEKGFKKDFPEYSPVICEQLNKLFKKRPKLAQSVATCSTLLIELGHNAVEGVRPCHLPQDCLDMLKALDSLDSASNAPAVVTDQSWDTLCRLRRSKIDSEFKIRALANDIAESETTVSIWQGINRRNKEALTKLQTELQVLHEEKAKFNHDLEVQLVLKQGLIEVATTGRIADFRNAVVVSRSEVHRVNTVIRRVGEEKLKAMRKGAEVRKFIVHREWEHHKLRMQVQDLDARLEVLDHVQVTKELQKLLIEREKGNVQDKTLLHSEEDVAAATRKFEKAQNELFDAIRELDEKISQLNKKNSILDREIVALNTLIGERSLLRDVEGEKREMDEAKKRMKTIIHRGKLIATIQEQQQEMLLLQNELDLLRWRTYPSIQQRKEPLL